MNTAIIKLLYPKIKELTDDDRRECLPMAARILEMSLIARQKGLLALEDYILQAQESTFFKVGAMVVDVNDPNEIKEIFQNFIMSTPYKGAELLKRVLIMEGVLMIAEAENACNIRERLLPFFGEEFYEEAWNYLENIFKLSVDNDDSAAKVAAFFADMGNETYLAGTNLLEEHLLLTSDDGFQLILREVLRNRADLNNAFYGSSKKMQKKIFDNVGKRIGTELVFYCLNMRYEPDTETIKEAQMYILKVCEKMIDEGIIVGSRMI